MVCACNYFSPLKQSIYSRLKCISYSRCDGASEARGCIQRAAIFKQAYKLAEAFVELPDQETIEPHAVLEQPEEGAAVHHRQTGVAQGHHIVSPGLVLEHGALAKPRTGG